MAGQKTKQVSKSVRAAVAILIAFGAGFSSAGERTVGNGGGLAEMKAARVLRQLPMFTEFCLAVTNPCDLAADEAAALNHASERLATESKTTMVDFKHDLKVRFETGSNAGDKLWILSTELYRKDGISKSFGEIGALVLEGLLTRGDATAGQMKLKSPAQILSEKVFAEIKEQTQSLQVGKNWIHLIRLDRGSSLKQEVLVVEHEKESFDLSTELAARLGCKSADSLESRFSSFGAAGSTADPKAVTALKWRCDQTAGSASVLIAPEPLKLSLSEIEMN